MHLISEKKRDHFLLPVVEGPAFFFYTKNDLADSSECGGEKCTQIVPLYFV